MKRREFVSVSAAVLLAPAAAGASTTAPGARRRGGAGGPVVVAPGFEVERVRRTTTVPDVRGWEEQDDPFALAARVATAMRRSGRLALDPTPAYGTYLRLAAAMPRHRVADGTPVFEHLRI